MKGSFWLAYLCDYEVGGGLNTDQASPRGKDVTSPGLGRHAGHAANKILGKLFHEQRQRRGCGDKLGVRNIYFIKLSCYKSGVCVLIESAFVLMR